MRKQCPYRMAKPATILQWDILATGDIYHGPFKSIQQDQSIEILPLYSNLLEPEDDS